MAAVAMGLGEGYQALRTCSFTQLYHRRERFLALQKRLQCQLTVLAERCKRASFSSQVPPISPSTGGGVGTRSWEGTAPAQLTLGVSLLHTCALSVINMGSCRTHTKKYTVSTDINQCHCNAVSTWFTWCLLQGLIWDCCSVLVSHAAGETVFSSSWSTVAKERS